MEFWSFIGWTLVFAVILFSMGIVVKELMFVILSFAAILAFLWILFQRIDRIERKLDELLGQEKEE